jgi:hypothetical protein
MKTRNTPTLLVAIVAGFLVLGATRVQAQGQMIGINVHLNQPPSNNILQDLGAHGQMLDVFLRSMESHCAPRVPSFLRFRAFPT